MSKKHKETLAERLKKVAIESRNEYKILNSITSIERKAHNINKKFGILNKITYFIENTANAYGDAITGWRISIWDNTVFIDAVLTQWDINNSTTIIKITGETSSPKIYRELSEIISKYLDSKGIKNYNSFRTYGSSVSNPIVLIQIKHPNIQLEDEKSLNESVAEVLGKLDLKLSPRKLDESALLKKTEFVTYSQIIPIVTQELEKAASLGAKHLKIEYFSNRGNIQFSISGTPDRKSDGRTYTLETDILDFFTLEYKKGNIIDWSFQKISKHLSDLGFKVMRGNLGNYPYYPGLGGYYKIIVELFNYRDIKR